MQMGRREENKCSFHGHSELALLRKITTYPIFKVLYAWEGMDKLKIVDEGGRHDMIFFPFLKTSLLEVKSPLKLFFISSCIFPSLLYFSAPLKSNMAKRLSTGSSEVCTPLQAQPIETPPADFSKASLSWMQYQGRFVLRNSELPLAWVPKSHGAEHTSPFITEWSSQE